MHGDEGLMIKSQDSSETEPVGFLYEETYYDPEILQKGMEYIATGINKFPNRLDMRFGEIYMLGQIKDYENFTKQIIQAVNYSATNNNAWTWSNSKPVEDPKAFFLSALQDYQVQLYNTESDEQLENMKRIAEAILKHYPDHVESLSNLAIVYLLSEQYDQALQPLLKAEKINPKDAIVLNNIAQTYKLLGETKKAIKYYKRTIKYGDAETQHYAQEQINILQGKTKATF
jgi:tetratricopeptide (TPR) repeat protein